MKHLHHVQSRHMGRKKTFGPRLIIRIRSGTTELIDAAKRSDETRSEFIRRAIERLVELEARAKLRGKKR
jgi:hypothetical protein